MRKTTYKDKGSHESSPPCIMKHKIISIKKSKHTVMKSENVILKSKKETRLL